MIRASRSRTPTSLRPRARKTRFASWIRPERISLPMIAGRDAGGRSQRTADVKQESQVIQRDAVTTSPATSPELGRGVGRSGQIKIHGPDAFEGMRRAGMLAAATLDFITPYVRPGV